MSTTIQLDKTRWAIKDLSGKLPTDACIWNAIRSKNITRTIREFLWKCLHNAYRLGKIWENIPGYEQRAICPICHIEESMEHILTECDATAPKIIWDLAEKLWKMQQSRWPQLKYGTILGCNMANFKHASGHINMGANRLYQIIISESAHLIWKLRCERRIQNEDNPEKYHTDTEIHNRWVATINNRLTMDQLMTDRKRYKKKALPQKIVIQTWKKVLADQENLLSNWIQQSGVLVGIRPKRPPGCNR
jgi:ribonuclease HI